MMLANETVLITIALVGIAGIVSFAIYGSYDDTIQSIGTAGSSHSAKLAESVGIIDVQKSGNVAYVIIANRSERAVTFTDFWDDDGNTVVCSDADGRLERLEIQGHSTHTISCIIGDGGTSDIVLFTSHYNIIRIET